MRHLFFLLFSVTLFAASSASALVVKYTGGGAASFVCFDNNSTCDDTYAPLGSGLGLTLSGSYELILSFNEGLPMSLSFTIDGHNFRGLGDGWASSYFVDNVYNGESLSILSTSATGTMLTDERAAGASFSLWAQCWDYSGAGYAPRFALSPSEPIGSGHCNIFEGPSTLSWEYGDGRRMKANLGPGFAVSTVPLPAAAPLLAASLCLFGFVGRRRKRIDW